MKNWQLWLPKMDKCESSIFQNAFIPALESVKKMSKKQLKSLEQEITDSLKEKGILEEVQDLLACDMYYETAGLSMRRYRSMPEVYLLIREEVRAEVLEDGILSTECIGLLWLFRETGVLHDLFTVSEQETIHAKITKHVAKQPAIEILMELEVHRAGEILEIKYLKFKKELFQNPYLQGVSVAFPFLERRQKVISYLQERGHFVEEIKHQNETILKIDNAYYRIFPTIRQAELPIQGVSLVPFYA